MNFDIKDVKSWNNRDNVEVGDKGYFANDIHFLDDIVSMNLIGAIEEIDENDVLCFKKNGANNFGFFLPIDTIKEDKTYRACRTVQELYELVFNTKSKDEESCYIEELLGVIIHLRNKETGTEYFTTISIITKDINDYIKVVVSLKGYLSFSYLSFTDLFNKYEIEIDGEWQPFGV